MELLLELVQTAGLGYLVYRKLTAKAPELRDLVKTALVDHLRDGAKSGRERLRARLAEKAAKR